MRDTSGAEPVERVTNELPLALAPSIRDISPNPVTRDASGQISVTLSFVPELRLGQRAALLLGDREVLPEPADPPPAQTAELDFVAAGVAAGDHFARLRFAGLDSILIDRAAVPRRFDESQRVQVRD